MHGCTLFNQLTGETVDDQETGTHGQTEDSEEEGISNAAEGVSAVVNNTNTNGNLNYEY